MAYGFQNVGIVLQIRALSLDCAHFMFKFSPPVLYTYILLVSVLTV